MPRKNYTNTKFCYNRNYRRKKKEAQMYGIPKRIKKICKELGIKND